MKLLRPVANPVPVLTPVQVCLSLAARAYLMSVLQAGGVYLIAHGSWYAGLSGFLISYHWYGAAKACADNRTRRGRLAYGLGGAIGTLTVLLVAHLRG